ncbi:MAG: hypothetical protein WC713_11295 [Candidatus Methylomirabilota bacterium]
MADKIEKLISILIEAEGAEEVEKKLQRMHDKAVKGSKDTKKGSEEAEPKVSLWMERWGKQIAMITGGLVAMYAVARYSTVASTMISLLGTLLGLLADTLLIYLLPAFLKLVDYLLDLRDKFEALPEPVKKLTALLLGLGAALLFLRSIGVISLAVSLAGMGISALAGAFGITAAGGILPTLGAMLAAGGLAAAAAIIVAVIAGLAIGFGVVALLIYSGVLDWVAQMGQAFSDKMPWLMDLMKVLFLPFGLLGVLVVDLLTGQWHKIPEHMGEVIGQAAEAFGRLPEAAWTLQAAIHRIFGLIGQSIIIAISNAVDRAKAKLATIPGVKTAASILSYIPGMPRFQSGGYVAEDGPIFAHKGEYVSSTASQRTRSTTGTPSGGGGITIQQVNLVGQWKDHRELYREFLAMLQREGRRVGLG